LSTSRHPGFEIKKYLYLEKNGVHIMGTAGVSDWMMLKAFVLVEHVIGWMINSSDRSKFAGHQFFIIRDKDPDLRTVGAAAQKGQRNTGSAKYTVINEALVCREAVDTIRPHDPAEYRGFDTPVHEFGHSIEAILGLAARSDRVYKMNIRDYDRKLSREYFSFSVQRRFGSAGRAAKSIPGYEQTYLSTIFSSDETWLPTCEK